MKKILTLLCTSLIVFLMYIGSGNVAFAHGEDPNCPCNFIKPIEGAEKNKIVANILASDEFKTLKRNKLENGYQWKGISEAEVSRFMIDLPLNPNLPNSPIIKANSIGVTFPIYTKDGNTEIIFFLNGKYLDNMEI